MTTTVIVQARLGSTRLPAKVLLPLPTGRTVLEEVLYRAKQIPGVDVVVAAIPDTAENDIVEAMALRELERLNADRDRHDLVAFGSTRVHRTVRGPEHDVLARYVKAAEAVKADVIMRITADCPLIDPKVCGAVLALRDSQLADYASNAWPARSYPHGLDCEVFTRALLELANAHCDCGHMIDGRGTRHVENPDREHVTPWMQRQPDLRRAHLKGLDDRSHLRWTLDTLEDYTRIWGVIEEQTREAA